MTAIEVTGYSVIDLGLTDYREAYDFQKECLEKVKSGNEEGFIIFTEHRAVFTLGRMARAGNLLVDEGALRSKGIDIIKIDRGGDITFHGPGQLVVYPILNLNRHYRQVHRFLYEIEDAVITALAGFGISSFRSEGRRGVWTDYGKIASIGIGISRWVSYHGLAINANVDLDYFKMINPCGLKGIRMTSMKEMLGRDIDMDMLKDTFLKEFCRIFDCTAAVVDIAGSAKMYYSQ